MQISRFVQACVLIVRVSALAIPATLGFADGYDFEAKYTAELFSNVDGGLKTGSRYMDNLDLTLEVDIEKAWGFGAGRLFIYGLYNNDNTFSEDLVGDLQVVSNIDAEQAWRIFELWYEFGEEPWSVRFGLYDLNTEFDVNETGGLFLNSSHGIGAEFSQSGENGPSIFPVSSLSVRGSWVFERFTARLAVLDGVPGKTDDPSSNAIHLSHADGILNVAELDVPLEESGRLWGGFWHYSADIESTFGQDVDKKNDGWYLGAERNFKIGEYSAAWFLRYGQTFAEFYPLKDYIGAGFVLHGSVRGRPHDQLGIAFASGRASDNYRYSLSRDGIETHSRETNLEFTYRAQINQHLSVQPDIQFVHNPSVTRTTKDAWVVGLRFELTF